MSSAVLNRAFDRARQQIQLLMTSTCIITPSVPPDETAVSITVACRVMNNPSAGSGSGGFSGRHGGGGNQIVRRFDRSFALPYGTQVSTASTLRWVEGAETITISDVENPGTHGMSVHVHGARVAR